MFNLTNWQIVGLISHMETKNEHHGGSDDFVDPLSHLAILKRSRRNPQSEALQIGPWWLALVWAAQIAAVALWVGSAIDDARGIRRAGGLVNWQTTGDHRLLLLSFLCLFVMVAQGLVQSRRRRVVRPRLSLGGSVSLGLLAIVYWSVSAVWHVFVLRVGYSELTTGTVVVAWALTGLLFLGLRGAYDRTLTESRALAI